MKCERCNSDDLTIFLVREDLIIYKCEECGNFIKVYKYR